MANIPSSNARFYNPPNVLKQKVGSGGLAQEILNQAQKLLEENDIDFHPMAENYLEALRRGLDVAYNPPTNTETEKVMSGLIYPIMQLKANGGMFHYPLITKISDQMISFLEKIEIPNEDMLEIVQAYYTTMRAILTGKIKTDGGQRGKDLNSALVEAYERYNEKYPSAS